MWKKRQYGKQAGCTSNTYTYNGLEEQLNIPYKMLVLARILYSLLSDHKLKLGLSFLTYKGKVGGCPWNF